MNLKKDKSHADLDIRNLPSFPIIIVYNPNESVILLIQVSGKEGLKQRKKTFALGKGWKKMKVIISSNVCHNSKKTLLTEKKKRISNVKIRNERGNYRGKKVGELTNTIFKETKMMM